LPETQPLGEALDEANSDRSRLANPQYSAHSRSTIARSPVRLNRGWPRASANSAVISRVESPRARKRDASPLSIAQCCERILHPLNRVPEK
jgi:hypothetical protein